MASSYRLAHRPVSNHVKRRLRHHLSNAFRHDRIVSVHHSQYTTYPVKDEAHGLCIRGGGDVASVKRATFAAHYVQEGVHFYMGLTWEKILRSLGIPDKAEDTETAAEFTGRNQPQIESGPWGDIPEQEGPRQYGGIPEAVTENAGYSDTAREASGGGEQGGGVQGGGEGIHHYQQRPDDGVNVSPTPITPGETVVVSYSGPLLHNNPQSLHLHWGIGPGDWEHVQDVAMQKEGDKYTATLEVGEPGNFEFCFRDGRDNWDNNNGRNWSYIVHDGDINR